MSSLPALPATQAGRAWRGDLNPDWLFIGEGPGADEDVQGEPFVGQAGKLLDNMLASLDIARGNRFTLPMR